METNDDIYDDVLREIYGETVAIAGLEYDTALALRRVDYPAYREGYLDYLDSRGEEE